MSLPTLPEFTAAVEQELRRMGESFAWGDLLEYAASVWQSARADPDPARWARAFLREVPAPPAG
jgi:hypothetical protein